jgi:hypothetical protein
MIGRHHIEPAFFDQAEELRAELDRAFARPYEESHTWQYFHVPELYTYLRARPENLVPRSLVDRFAARLESWALTRMGLVPTAAPLLHLMVNGCSLSLHSDFHNGTFGYVHSLTRWDRRNFSGGETLLLHDGSLNYKPHQAHGPALYESIAPEFNQLLVFDDRIVHATQLVLGGMDPSHGRLALVGHLRATSPRVVGPLDHEAARSVIVALLARVAETMQSERQVLGTMTYRLEANADGSVAHVEVLTDALVTRETGYAEAASIDATKAHLIELLTALRFPPAAGSSHVFLPVLLPMVDLTPLRITVPLRTSERALKRVPDALESAKLGLSNSISRDGSLEVSGCLAGSARVEGEELVLTFEPPMWVPSQRAAFESQLRDALEKALNQDAS